MLVPVESVTVATRGVPSFSFSPFRPRMYRLTTLPVGPVPSPMVVVTLP